MPPKAADGSLESLQALVQSTVSLITQLKDDLYRIYGKAAPLYLSAPSPPQDAAPASVDALALAHDAASLIKAHATKLSLLIINEPFTASAIAKVLQELVAGPIPAIASAAQLCAAHTYTDIVRNDVNRKCRDVLGQTSHLVETIPLDGNVLSADSKDAANGRLFVTGLLFAACDEVIMLKQLGIAGILTKKAEGYKDILQDVFEELKEWSELDSEEDHNDEPAYDSSDGSQDPQASAQQMIDDLMTPSHIPLGDPHRIRERLDSSLKRLRLTTLLFSAIIKRRIKTLPPLLSNQATPIAQRLDEVYPILERLPDHFNELTTAFYELDPAGIDRTMDLCFFDAFAAAEMLKAPWTGTEDAFTEWVDKFQLSIKKHDEKTATVP